MAQPFVFSFWAICDKSLRVYQNVWLSRLWLWPHQALCDSASFRPSLLEAVGHNPLWLKTWKHLNEAEGQIWHSGSWFWFGLPRPWNCIHIHIVKILQSTRHYAWRIPIFSVNRYVELWLHFNWALHWIPLIPWHQRTWTNLANYWRHRLSQRFSSLAVNS